MVRDDEVGLARLVPGQLDEALGAVRTVGGAQTLPHWYRDLRPCRGRVRGSVVTIGQPAGLSLLLRPLTEGENLGAEDRVRRGIDGAQRAGEFARGMGAGLGTSAGVPG